VLTQKDLPTGFAAMPAAQLGEMEKNLPAGSRAFGFTHEEGGQAVLGMLIPYETKAEQRVFDASLPYMVDVMAASLGAEGDPQMMGGLDDVGESRVASTSLSTMGAVGVRWDMVGFRRGGVGALVFVMYMDGEEPAVSVGDLARKLDARIKKDQAG
jgi:hypothetical protein